MAQKAPTRSSKGTSSRSQPRSSTYRRTSTYCRTWSTCAGEGEHLGVVSAELRITVGRATSDEARAATYSAWLHFYNHHRPHTGIGGLTPAARVHNLTGNCS
jgi:transposase InsO family protein